jgi:hypothetical protein
MSGESDMWYLKVYLRFVPCYVVHHTSITTHTHTHIHTHRENETMQDTTRATRECGVSLANSEPCNTARNKPACNCSVGASARKKRKRVVVTTYGVVGIFVLLAIALHHSGGERDR